MKSYILIGGLLLFSGTVSAQSREDIFPKTASYFIKNGALIKYEQIDSVLTSWGGKFQMEHKGNVIYLSPSTTDDAKELEALKAKAGLLPGHLAPDFSLINLDGKKISLSDFKGKVVVLNFWFTTCSPCIAEMPALNLIRKDYLGKNVVFLALGRDDVATIKTFLKKHNFNYLLLADAVTTAAAFKVDIYPTSIVIDKNGIIRFVAITGDKIEQTIPDAINLLL